jgi:hypothetical protein
MRNLRERTPLVRLVRRRPSPVLDLVAVGAPSSLAVELPATDGSHSAASSWRASQSIRSRGGSSTGVLLVGGASARFGSRSAARIDD